MCVFVFVFVKYRKKGLDGLDVGRRRPKKAVRARTNEVCACVYVCVQDAVRCVGLCVCACFLCFTAHSTLFRL